MAKGMHLLSDVQCKNRKVPGYLSDGGNLYLQVTVGKPRITASTTKGDSGPRVRKSWVFRYRTRATGRSKELGLGRYPDITLEMARAKALDLRRMLANGKDPAVERDIKRAAQKVEDANSKTFDQAARDCIEARRPGWKNAKHASQWANTLKAYASPLLGDLPVSTITDELVIKVLEPIWLIKNETASRVRQRLEVVLDWARVKGFRKGDNPARWKGHLELVLPKLSDPKNKKHHPALAYSRMPAFMRDLRKLSGTSARALEFTILTACRTREVVGARWEEFDVKAALWTIPAIRMKAKTEHKVPLSPQALVVIKLLSRTRQGAYVFPGQKAGRHLSTGAMAAVLKRMNRMDITVHGFRSSFRDWAGETLEYARELAEFALAHQLKDKAEAAYARSTLPERRRPLMKAWADHCAGGGSGLRKAKKN